jgi:hypothetical protein
MSNRHITKKYIFFKIEIFQLSNITDLKCTNNYIQTYHRDKEELTKNWYRKGSLKN